MIVIPSLYSFSVYVSKKSRHNPQSSQFSLWIFFQFPYLIFWFIVSCFVINFFTVLRISHYSWHLYNCVEYFTMYVLPSQFYISSFSFTVSNFEIVQNCLLSFLFIRYAWEYPFLVRLNKRFQVNILIFSIKTFCLYRRTI